MSYPDDHVAALEQTLRRNQTLLRLAEATNPQQLIEVLLDSLSTLAITASSLWLYAPTLRQNIPPISAHIELVGGWSAQSQSQLPIGTKLQVSELDFIAQLADAGYALSPQVETDFIARSKMLRMLVSHDQLAGWGLFNLRVAEQNYGLLLVGFEDAAHIAAATEILQDVLPVVALNVSQFSLKRDYERNYYGGGTLIDGVTDGILVTYPTPTGANILMANQSFYDLFNIQQDIARLPLTSMLEQLPVPSSLQSYLAEEWAYIDFDQPTVRGGMFDLVTPAGTPAKISWYTSLLTNPQNNETFGRLFILHDTTPEVAAVQVRSAFLSRVSHELRTPLMAISGFAEALLENSDSELYPNNREYVEIIHQSAGKLKHLFTELIEITRAEAGQLQLNFSPVHLGSVAQAVVKHYEAEASTREQQIAIHIADDLPPAYADVDRITRVFDTVIANAIRYTPEGGTVTITIQPIDDPKTLPQSAPPDVVLPALLVSVLDSGAGIPADEIEDVFELFYRMKSAWSQHVEGTGVGLALSRSLIELQRGRIWAEPATPGNPGGSFHFTIPIATTP